MDQTTHKPDDSAEPESEYFEVSPDGDDEMGGEDILESSNDDTGEDSTPIGSLQSERDDLQQRLLRVSADYQNFVRRADQNVKTAAEQKLMDVARSLITVLDQFDRALEVDSETTSAQDVLKGVTMVKGELLTALSRFGIERLEVAAGQPFDPMKHEALLRQPSEEFDADSVTLQMQPGYTLGDKVIRPAQVGVAE